MTAFFGVHLVLTVVSLALGTIIGVLGIRASCPTTIGRCGRSRSIGCWVAPLGRISAR